MTASDETDGGVGGGRRLGGMTDGAAGGATLAEWPGAGGGTAGRIGGIAGRVVGGAEAGANALGDTGAAPGIRAGAMAPSADGAAGAPAGADDRAAAGLPGIGAGWPPRGMPAGAIDGRPGATGGAVRGGAAGAAVAVAVLPAGRLGAKLGANPGANAGRGAGAEPAGAPAGGTRTDEPGVGRSAGGAIGALPIPNGATGGTPRDGVTAGRAELAMLCAGAAGADAAGRSPVAAGTDTRWGAGWARDGRGTRNAPRHPRRAGFPVRGWCGGGRGLRGCPGREAALPGRV